MHKNIWISIKISLKFVTKGPINNIPALVQTMAWRRPGDKPLSGPMMVNLLTHICFTRPRWVNLKWIWMDGHIVNKWYHTQKSKACTVYMIFVIHYITINWQEVLSYTCITINAINHQEKSQPLHLVPYHTSPLQHLRRKMCKSRSNICMKTFLIGCQYSCQPIRRYARKYCILPIRSTPINKRHIFYCCPSGKCSIKAPYQCLSACHF